MNKIITPRIAAEVLGVSERRVQQLIQEFDIKPERIGKTAVLSKADVRRLANRKTTPGKTAKK